MKVALRLQYLSHLSVGWESMDSLFSFKLLFSWFLVWWMSLDSCTLNILVIMLGDLRSLKFSFQQAVTLFRLGMHALAKFCGLWFQCHSDFQSLYAVILLCLIYLLPPGLSLVSTGSLWKGRIFPRLHHLVNLTGRGSSPETKSTSRMGA